MKSSRVLPAAAAIVLVAIGAWALLARDRGGPFVHVASRPGPAGGDRRVLVHSALPAAAPEFRAAAEANAGRWAPGAGNVAVHYFESLPAAQIGNEYEAQLTYCMHGDGRPAAWMTGGGDCFAPPTTKGAARK